MIRNLLSGVLLLALPWTSSCTMASHDYKLAPELESLLAANGAPLALTVAWELTPKKAAVVQAHSGKGLAIEFRPYSDLEYGIETVLDNCFESVTSDLSRADLVFGIEIETGAEWNIGLNAVTPADFMIAADATLSRPGGALVWRASIVGEGSAESLEIADRPCLAGERAASQMLAELQASILNSIDLRGFKR